MNITIHVPAPLTSAMEGRRRVDLGVPATADVGDVLQALFALYPRLAQHVAQDKPRPGTVQLQLLFEPNDRAPLRLKEGHRVYLVADQPRRLTEPASEG